ncbi:MAG: hypothetical protein LBT23_05575, partial [Synergistaceae bacterium]|nr:hypothetical protein [Synergistaceae bacterium]
MEENQKTNYAGKKFEVGEVLAQSWSMLFRNPLVFFGLPFLAAVISIILGFTLLRNMDLIRSIFSLFL